MSSLDKNLSTFKCFRNNKKKNIGSRHCGWVKPSASLKGFVSNPLLTPRRLFKHKDCQKFVRNNRLTCLPAHRMINHAVKVRMRPTGGPLDMHSINPKILFQVFSEWLEGKWNQTFPKEWKGKSWEQMEMLVRHRYEQKMHMLHRYYIFNHESPVSMDTSDKHESDTFIKFLMWIIKRKGGWIQYINEAGFWRIDGMGGVQKSPLLLRTWPDEPGGCPGRICGFCGCPNIYSRRDVQPSSKPKRSSRPDLPPNQTYDDQLLTEELAWEEKDGIITNFIDIAWRCRACFANLAVRPADSVGQVYLEVLEHVTMHYIGGLLDQLKLTRVTDFYDDCSPNDRQFILDHDLSMAKRMLIRMWNGIVYVPTTIKPDHLIQLSKSMPQLSCVKSINANTTVDPLTIELTLMTAMMRSIMGSTLSNIDGSLLTFKDNNTTYTNYSDWLLPSIHRDGSFDQTKLFGPAALTRSLGDLLNCSNSTRGIYVVLPLSEGKSDYVLTKVYDSTINSYWFVNQKQQPLRMNKHTWTALNSDIIKTKSGSHYIIPLHVGRFSRLVMLTPGLHINNAQLNYYDLDSSVKLTLPIPQLINYDNNKLEVGVKCLTSELDAELFRALCIRNISGKMEFSALCQYAIAFNMRRYTTGKVVLKQNHVNYRLIHFNVFACLYSMKMQNNRNFITKFLVGSMTQENMKSMVVAILPALKHIKIPDNVQWALSLVDSVSSNLATGRVPNSLKYLHSAVASVKRRSCRVFELDTTVVPPNMPKPMTYSSQFDKLMWAFTFDTVMSKLRIKMVDVLRDLLKTGKPAPNKTVHFAKPASQIPVQPNTNRVKLIDAVDQILTESNPIRVDALIQKLPTIVDEDEPPDALVEVMHPMFTRYTKFAQATDHNGSDCSMMMPLLESEYTIVPDVDCTHELIELPNTEVNSCGYEAYQYITTTNLTLPEFKQCVGSNPPFDESQLFYAAEQDRVNVCIYNVVTNTLQFVKFATTDEFATLAYIQPKPGFEIGHFAPVKLTFNKVLNYYRCDPDTPHSLRVNELNKANKLHWLTQFEEGAEANFLEELAFKLTMQKHNQLGVPDLRQTEINGKVIISNGKSHNLKENQFNFELTLNPNLSDWLVGDRVSVNHSIFESELTIPSAIPSDLTKLHKLMQLDEIKKIAECQQALLSKDNSSCVMLNQLKVVKNNYLMVNLGNNYVKPLDKVGIKFPDGSVNISTVRLAVNNAAYIDLIEVPDKFTLLISKISVMSCIKRVIACEIAGKDGDKLALLLANARCINGYAGSGKSQLILNELSKSSHVVTMTSVAKQNLINRGYPTSQVKTFERATWDRIDKPNLYVDEANMLDYADLSLIVDNYVERMTLLYDSTQINKFDSISLPGISSVKLITQYPVDIEKWNYSTRFGGELTVALKEHLLPDLQLNTDVNTKLNIENLTELSLDSFKELLLKFRPDVVLHAYTAECNKMNEWLQQLTDLSTDATELSIFRSVTITKAHSFQGNEADRVMYIQWRMNSGLLGLCRNKNYVLSALTRSRHEVSLISCGRTHVIKTLRDAVNTVGGSLVSLKDHLEHDPKATAELLNTLLVSENVTATYNDEEVWLYKGSLYVGKYMQVAGNWRGYSNLPMVHQQLNSALNEPPGHSVKPTIQNAEEVRICDAARLRALCWVIDMMVNSGYMTLGGSLTPYRLKKSPGCPYMCGLSVYERGKIVLHVSDGWSSIDSRTITYDALSDVTFNLLPWLQGLPSDSWLDKIVFNTNMQTYMMIDRAITLPMAALQFAGGNDKLSGPAAQDNANWKNFILTKHGLNANGRWRSTVRHTMLIVERALSNKFTGRLYTLATYQYTKNFSQYSHEDVWVDVFNTCLSSVKPVMRKKREIGAFGMFMTPDQHIEKETKVGKFLRQYNAKWMTREREPVAKMIMISNSTERQIHDELGYEKDIKDYLTHNAITNTTAHSEFMDSYLLARFGAVAQGTNIKYTGLNLHLVPVSNKHYIKLTNLRGTGNEPMWLNSLDMCSKWYEEYDGRIQDLMVDRANEIKKKNTNLSDKQLVQAVDELSKLKNLKSQDLNVVDPTFKSNVSLIGMVALTLPSDHFIRLLRSSEKTIMVAPLTQNYNPNDLGSDHITTKVNCTIQTLLNDGYVKFGSVDVRVNLIDNVGPFGVFNVVVARQCKWINTAPLLAGNPLCNIRVPSLEVGPDNTLRVVPKLKHVDRRLADRLLNYCIANKPTLDKLLAYVRSLLSTYDSNRTGIFATYHTNIESAIDTAVAVLTMYKLNYSGILLHANASTMSTEITTALLNLNHMLNGDGQLSALVSGATERLTNIIGLDLRNIAKCVSELEATLDPTNLDVKRFKQSNNNLTPVTVQFRPVKSTKPKRTKPPAVTNVGLTYVQPLYFVRDKVPHIDIQTLDDDTFFDASDGTPEQSLSIHSRSPTPTLTTHSNNLPTQDLLPKVMELIDDIPDNNTREIYWTYWQSNGNTQQDELVKRCQASIRNNIGHWKLVELNPANEHLYVPAILLKLKQQLTIQCWSDVVRMWLLVNFGGVWIDASVFMTNTFTPPHAWLEHKKALFFTEYIDSQTPVFENWVMAVRAGEPYMRAWMKCFMTVVCHGNNIKRAMPDLNKLADTKMANINEDETYLTMHQMCKLAQLMEPVPDSMTMSGFTGPLGWIQDGPELYDWLIRIVRGDYKPQAGMVKLINMARTAVCKWEEETGELFTIKPMDLNDHLDFVVISVGTGGDILSGHGITSQLLEHTNKVRHITVDNSIDVDNKDHIHLDVDFLDLSVVKFDNIGNNLGFVKTLFLELTRKLQGVTSQYLVANFHVPCMMQMSRLIGAVPVNMTAIPLYSESSGYNTMQISQESAITEVVNSLTKAVALDHHLPWNYDGVHKGKRYILTWFNCIDKLVANKRNTITTYQIGNVVDGQKFSTDMDLIIAQQLGNKQLVDVILPGPKLSALNNQKFKHQMQITPRKQDTLIIISSTLKNLASKAKLKLTKYMKTHYKNVTVINNINILRLNGLINICYCHGGQSTVNDAMSMSCRVVSFGEYVDQPYWTDLVKTGNISPTNDLTKVIRTFLNRPSTESEHLTMDYLASLNNLRHARLRKYKHKVHATVTYDPVVVENCVKMCVMEWSTVYGHKLELELDDICEPLMQVDDIVAMAFEMSVNLTLVKNDLATTYEFSDEFDTIALSIDTSENLWHAKLCTFVTLGVSLDEPNVNDTVGLVHQPKSVIMGCNNTETLELQQLCHVWDTKSLIKMQPLADKVVHTLRSSNLTHRRSRVAQPTTIIEIETHDGNVARLMSGSPPRDKLLGFLTNDGWMLGFVVTLPDMTAYCVTEKPLRKQTNLVIDLGCKLMHKSEDSTRLDTSEKYNPLNVRTLKQLDSTTVNWNYSRKLANEHSTNVVVYDYDNRGHDKYDEQQILLNANVLWLGVDTSKTIDDKLAETYGRDFRLTYYRGLWAWRLDTKCYGDIWLLKALCVERLHDYVIQNGITLKSTLDVDDERSVTNYLKKVKDPVMVDNAIVRKTKKEWMSVLGIWGLTFETFSNKVCTIHEDETFSCRVKHEIPSSPERGNWDLITAESMVTVSKHVMFSAYQRVWLIPCGKGGNAFAEEEKISLGNSGDWWKKLGEEPVILKDLTPNPLTNTFVALGQTTANEWTNTVTMDSADQEPRSDEQLDFSLMVTNKSEVYEDIVPHDIQNMWLNTDLSMDLRQYAPINSANIRTKENPDKIKDLVKVSLNQPTPMESRPVLTKWVFEEHRSITGRLFSKIRYRKARKTVGVKTRLQQFVKTYFDGSFRPYTTSDQLLDVDEFETMKWISKRRDGLKIAQELNELFTSELGVIPLNAINIHLKLESLLKQEPFMHWGQHQARAIYWQRKAIAAISSPVFLKVKTRLKNSLKSKFVYADGLTPDELNQKARNTQNVNWFFENDLSKQDRQTDKPILDLEMELYRLLGVTESMLKWWKTMHQQWKFRARWNKGYASEMRLTGQSTTSLGNLITNMQVHLKFITEHFSTIKLVLMLGDDILIMFSDKPDTTDLGRHTKEAHNMKSTQRLSDTSGVFCCMIGYKNSNGSAEIGPDYLRLRYRFEVTNGVSQANAENIEARCQSYACMLGKTEEMRQLCKVNGWTIPLLDWYDPSNLMFAIADRYDVSEMDVLNHYNKLTQYLASPQIIEHTFNVYTAAKVY